MSYTVFSLNLVGLEKQIFMHSFLLHYLVIWRPLGYGLVFLGMILEGDISLFTTAFLTRLDYFDFFDIIFFILAGAVIGDSLWYGLGRWLKNSSFFVVRWAAKIVSPFDNHIKEKNFRTNLISKFTYGVHHLTLVRNGMLGIPYKEFLRNDFLALLIWVAVIGGLGYLFGASYVLIRHYLKFVEVGLLLIIIIFILFDKLISRRLRDKL
jgi:membrane-associated protein